MSVRLCVRVSTLKCQITFDRFVGWQPNFQGPLNSSQVIFGQVILTPEPPGSGRDPEKGGFMPNLSPPGVLGQGGRVAPLRNRDDLGEQSIGSGILIFCPWPKKTGLAGRAPKT